MQDTPKSVPTILTTQKLFTGNLTPAKIAILYALVGGLWILFSDRLLALFVNDTQILTRLQTAKGWFYVVVTAWMLYVLVDWAISERRQIEEELRFQKSVLEAQSESSPAGILVVSDERKWLSFNRRFVEMWQIPEDVVQRRISNAGPVLATDQLKDPERFLAEIEYLYQHPDEKKREEIELKDGRVFDRYTAPVKGPDGTYYGRVWYYRDITERNQAQKALLESEQKYRNLVENSLYGLLIFQDNTIVFANPTTAQISGYTIDELISLSPSEVRALVHPQDQDMVFDQIQKRLAGEITSTHYEFRIIGKDGKARWLEVSPHVIEYQGRPAIQTTLVDVTERKRAAEVLRESEERYRTLFEGVPIGLYRTTPDGKILDVNTAVVEMFGYPNREALLAANAKDLYLVSDVRQQWLDSLVEEKVVWAEKQERRFDGSLIWVRDTARTVLDDQGQVLYYEGALEDITERKRLEDQLRQSQKMEAVGRLTAGIAHDFNNLLTAINGFAELMKLEIAQEDPQQESLDKILNSGRRAADLVRQLLAFSRRQVIDPKALNLNTSVINMDKMLRRVIGENIELHTNLAPDLWLVKADSSQIEQLIINLAVNARDAMPNGGRLTIETTNVVLDEEYVAHHLDSKPGDYVLLAVSDTGHGISEEVKPYIFEPFFTTKKQGQGTGLGLSTVYGIVKQNGGNIWIYSEEGQGTTIRIYLPRSRTTADLPVVHGENGVEMPFGIETILLVEDDLHVRELARLVLRGRGYTLLEAENGQEALDLAARYAGFIHLLLTDVVMPGISGKELADTLVQTRPQLKILYMSGYTDNAIVHHGVLDADVDLLQKPFSPLVLARKVRTVLDS